MRTDGLIQHFQAVKSKRERNLADYRWQGRSQFSVQAVTAGSWFFIFIFLHQINLLEEAGISVGLKLPSPGASDSNQNSMYHSLDLLLSVCSRKFKQHAQFVIYMCQYYLLGKGQGRRKSFYRSALKCPSRGIQTNNSSTLLASSTSWLSTIYWILHLDLN